MSARVCGSCGAAGGDKYKCAQCRTFKYCSVACYKQHQLSCPKAVQPAAAAPAQPPPSSGDAAAASSSAAAGSVAAAASPAVPSPAAPAVPKSTQSRVADADLQRLAQTPAIVAALDSAELQSILQRIDSGGGGGGGGKGGNAGASAGSSDEARIAMLEKYRATNSDFEAFVQQVLGVINQEG